MNDKVEVVLLKKRQLGNSDLFVTELGFGAMSLPTDVHEVQRIIDQAIDEGVNFFDTADLYDNGKNELTLGKALKNNRQNIILATKVGNEMKADGKSWNWNPSKKYIMKEIHNTLQRLGTDYIDLYQLHGGMMEDDVDETIDAFESLKKEGIIREYGISSIRPNVIERFLEKSSAVSVMMQYSLLDRRPEEWFSMIASYGASVITRGTIAKGLLTNESLERLKHSKGFGLYTQEQLVKTMTDLHRLPVHLHAAAIAFTLQTPTVATALIGARNVEQLQASLAAYNEVISTEELTMFTELLHLHQYTEHRTS